MVRADIADVPSRLPELLALALGGEEVRFTERDRDVLSLSSLEEKTADESPEERRRREAHEGDLEILRRQVPLTREQMLALGIIPAKNPLRGPLPPPVEGGSGSLLETLLRMRDEEYAELGIPPVER